MRLAGDFTLGFLKGNQTMKKSFTFYCDPGHGWLKVSKSDCNFLGLSAIDFSRYSYQENQKSGLQFYLEEDCDARIFLDKFKAVYGHGASIREKYTEKTRIRDMAHIPGNLNT